MTPQIVPLGPGGKQIGEGYVEENMKNILNFDKGLESPSIIRNFTKEEIILKSPEQKQSMDSGDGRNFTTMQNLTLNKC